MHLFDHITRRGRAHIWAINCDLWNYCSSFRFNQGIKRLWFVAGIWWKFQWHCSAGIESQWSRPRNPSLNVENQNVLLNCIRPLKYQMFQLQYLQESILQSDNTPLPEISYNKFGALGSLESITSEDASRENNFHVSGAINIFLFFDSSDYCL